MLMRKQKDSLETEGGQAALKRSEGEKGDWGHGVGEGYDLLLSSLRECGGANNVFDEMN